MFYWIKTHWIIKKLFSKLVWDIPNNDNNVFLTFDDGPTPNITNWVLNLLEQHHAKATFFCIGANIEKHPEIFQSIISQGHKIGNHTQNHLNGWETSTTKYIDNVKNCYLNNSFDAVKLFRPPYGKIKMAQSRAILKLGFKIIMWDVLSADFDQYITKEKCLENVLKNIKSGSIIVFHDSEKAYRNLEYVLPRTLKFLDAKGFNCKSLEDSEIS